MFEWGKCWTVNQNWIDRNISSFQKDVCLTEIRYCNSTDLAPCLCFATCKWVFSFLRSSAVKPTIKSQKYTKELSEMTTNAWLAKLEVRALCSRLTVSGNTSNEYLWKQCSKRHIHKGDSWCRQVPDNYFLKNATCCWIEEDKNMFSWWIAEENYPEFWGTSSLSCWRPGCLSSH